MKGGWAVCWDGSHQGQSKVVPDGHLDKPAYPKIIFGQYKKALKLCHKMFSSVTINDTLFFGPISVLLRLEFILVGETFPNAELLFPLPLLLMFLWSLESSSVQHKGQEATHDENINWPYNQPTLYLSPLRQNVSWDRLVSRKCPLLNHISFPIGTHGKGTLA